MRLWLSQVARARAMIEQEAPEQCNPACAGYRVVHAVVLLPAGVVPIEHPSITCDEFPNEHLLLLSTCVYHPGSLVSGWLDWRVPTAPHTHIVSIPPATCTGEEGKAVERVLRIIANRFEALRFGGRPPSATRYYSREQFHAKYPGARAETERRCGAHPRDEDIARALAISLPTFRRYVRDYGRPVQP